MKGWRWSVVAAVVLLAAALVPPVGADEVGKRPSVVRPTAVWYPTAFAVTPPVSQLPPVAPDVSGLPREVPNRPVNPAELPVLTFPDAKGPQGAPQGEGAISGSSGAYAPAPSVSFASLGSDHNQAIVGFRVAPPDTEGAVGPNHYIQWVNLVWAVYNKSGALVGGPWAGNSLWQALPSGSPCRTRNDGDPIVLYDHGADRWLMSQFGVASAPYYTCLAVSQTPDPLGPWYVWQYLYSNSLMNDYPKFGVWPDGYYMTVNEFGSGQSATTVFDRTAMLAGAANPAAVYFQIDALQPAFPQPTHWDGGPPPPAGSPNYNIAFYDDAWGNPIDALQICSFSVNWGSPGSSTFTCPAGWGDPGIIDLTAAGLSFDSNLCGYSRDCIPQQGTSQKLDALSDRLMFPANYRNLLGTLGYEVMVLTHSVDANGADKAGVRWYELRKYPAQPWAVYQGGTFSPDAHHRWMGSAAVDQNGNIGLVYSISSSTMYPSVGYTGRLVGDPLGTMQTEGIAVAGGGYQSGVNRWGDYASIHTDPDGCAFWGTAEYVANTGSFDWDTWVVAFTMPGCTPSGFGTLNGTVINANTLAPIGGATVQAGAYSTTTQANGTYAMNLPVGTYDVTASAFGYAPQTVNGVSITDGNTTTQDFALTPTASAELDGFVVGQAHGWPLYAKVDVKVGGSTVASTYTNPFNGYYYFASLPALQNYDLVVTAQVPGYFPGTRTIFLAAMGQTENFALQDNGQAAWTVCRLVGGINEGFEGTWPPNGWTVTHDSGNPNCLWTNVSSRSNLTGGTGKFAIADSDTCGSGTTMGT
ncbi:MAG: carboxypeptidase regulatory-like domain-containing protein, partial [Acidobacteriota bacterium]